MKFVYRLAAILAIIGLALGVASAQDNQDQSVESFLMSYINLLNTRDFAPAYAMIDSRTDSYQQFVAGYDHTVRIVPYFGVGDGAAGSNYVTSILLGYQDDGTIETYYGYFQLHSGMLFTPIRNNGGWVIGSARFELLADGDALHNDVMQDLLSEPWQEHPLSDATPTGLLLTISEMNTDLARSIFAYYDQINTGYYGNAYNMWLTTAQGLSRNYAPSYNNFVAGYSDTTYVMTYAGVVQNTPASSYLIGYLPAVLVGQHSDGSFVTYSGCYALGRFSTGGTGIVNGSFSKIKDDAPSAQETFDALASLNCVNLHMGL